MYFLTVWNEITVAIVGAVRGLMLTLCDTIYRLIIFCFNVFEKIGTARLLDNETVNILYEKVGLILGIYMIFRLTFVAVQYVLDPDKMTDKSKGAGKLLMKVIVVIVLLGTTPFIFNIAYKIQYSIARENVLGKIFLSSSDDYSNFGGQLSWYLFSTFYKETEEEISDSDKCPELYSGLIKNDFINNSSLKYTYNCVNERVSYQDIENGTSETYVIDFDGFLATVTGIAMLWIIVMYTISVGFRLIQLAFLELIAPLPIMMYLEPKDDGPFQKWVKLCISCYLDYFIRTAIIYFICYLVNAIMDIDTSYFFTTLGSTTDNEYRYITVIIIFGLLTFAKKLPDLIKEIMPSSGSSFSDFGLSFKKRADNMVGGSYINKGFDKVKGLAGRSAKAVGLMPLHAGKKVISGIDSSIHGKGFWNGFTREQGNLTKWLNKQRETLTPNSYKLSQERREGRENVNAINKKWHLGTKIAQELMKENFGGSGEENGWDKALNGTNRANYEKIFKNKEFINSKFALDQASKEEEKYRYAMEQLRTSGKSTIEIDGTSYNGSQLASKLDGAQKKLKGLEDVHAEISKQYQQDAEIEKAFKFIKNNSINPSNPSETHKTVGILEKKVNRGV